MKLEISGFHYLSSYIHRERVVWSCWLHGHPDIWHFSLHLRGLELRFHKFDNSKSKWLFLTPSEEFRHTESCDIKNSTWVFWYQPSPQPSGIHISTRPSDSGWYGCPRAETRADIKIPMCYSLYHMILCVKTLQKVLEIII